MKVKKEKIIFVCQVSEQVLKIGKYLIESGGKPKFLALEKEAISPDSDSKLLAEKIRLLFKKLGYSNDNVVVCLLRSQATCRYIKIPSVNPHEV